ncbi:MAG: hypothetical protein P4M10_05085 [Verrucomicrobiae bacterium]|nr:hypothetical protein [Verrucomicrobiae bacterium]
MSELVTTRTYSRKGGKPGGRILRGHTYDHNPDQLRCGGSIPTRFQRILMPRDSVLVKTSTRFNDQHFYKSLFNKDPGPGSYKADPDGGESHSFSRRGYGNGFLSRESRSTMSSTSASNPQVGPGKYSVETGRCKGLASKVFAYTGRKCAEDDDVLKLNIPFDENNPLNYVKPITLNVYLKPTMPGPGEYEAEKPRPANACCSAFVSATARMQSVSTKDEVPGAAHYYVKSSFENYTKNAVSNRVRSVGRRLRKSTVTYEWLRENADVVNKTYTQRSDKDRAEIVHYGMLDQAQKLRHLREQKEAASKERLLMAQLPAEVVPTPAFVVSDTDRFGEPIRPKKPIELRPGPGEYESAPKERGQVAAGCACVFRKKEEGEEEEPKVRGNAPGPAFYNPQKESAKLSFHLNVNRKWI